MISNPPPMAANRLTCSTTFHHPHFLLKHILTVKGNMLISSEAYLLLLEHGNRRAGPQDVPPTCPFVLTFDFESRNAKGGNVPVSQISDNLLNEKNVRLLHLVSTHASNIIKLARKVSNGVWFFVFAFWRRRLRIHIAHTHMHISINKYFWSSLYMWMYVGESIKL